MTRELLDEVRAVKEELLAQPNEEVAELLGIVDDLMRIISAQQIGEKRGLHRELAAAVVEFAEWQTGGYTGDVETKELIAETLWDTVRKNVRDVINQSPQIPFASQQEHEQSFHKLSLRGCTDNVSRQVEFI